MLLKHGNRSVRTNPQDTPRQCSFGYEFTNRTISLSLRFNTSVSGTCTDNREKAYSVRDGDGTVHVSRMLFDFHTSPAFCSRLPHRPKPTITVFAS